MAVQNYPTGVDTDKVSLGPHVCFYSNYSAPAGAGVTPATSIGGIKEGSIEFTTEYVTQELGFPRTENKNWVKRQIAVYNMTIWEHDQNRVLMALGEGATPTLESTVEFGGNLNPKEYSFLLEHELSGGQTEYWDIFRCVNTGSYKRDFTEDGENLVEISFKCMAESRDWVNDPFEDSRHVIIRRRELPAA
jgi:hypothetical protein